MINEKSLKILRCPVSGSQLTNADSTSVVELNKLVTAGEVMDISGRKIESTIDGLLVNREGTVGLPVRSGVTSLVKDRAIALDLLPINFDFVSRSEGNTEEQSNE